MVALGKRQASSLNPDFKRSYSFKAFQDLPALLREGLAESAKTANYGDPIINTTRVVEYMIRYYDRNQTLAIGELVSILDNFFSDPMNHRMVSCYVDHGCNMLAAKLAWREDY